jgi:type I restriction enzyme, S subunit
MDFDTELLEDSEIRLIDGDRGKNYPKQADLRNLGHCLFLSAKNVTQSGFEFSQTTFIDVEKDEMLRAGKLQRGDIVLTTRGTIGNVAFYGDDIPFDHVRINSGMMIFRANENRWNRRFLYFLLTSSFVGKQIKSLTSGSAVPQLPARDLKKFRLPRIPLEIQNSIEKIIGDLGDKIELNRQINQTLEEMAQAIFKSWFVDFDPTRAKAEVLAADGSAEDSERATMRSISGKSDNELSDFESTNPTVFNELKSTAALFPVNLQDSELGEIPQGWKSDAVINVAEFTNGAAYKNMHFRSESYTRPVVKIVELKNGVSPSTKFTNTQLGDKYRIDTGDILFSWSGSPETSIDTFIWIGGKAWLNQHIFKVSNASRKDRCFTFWLLKYLKPKFIAIAKDKQTTGLGHVTRRDLANLKYCSPNDILLDSFDRTAGPILEQIECNLTENSYLGHLKNTLLPRLLSGEIEVSQGLGD